MSHCILSASAGMCGFTDNPSHPIASKQQLSELPSHRDALISEGKNQFGGSIVQVGNNHSIARILASIFGVALMASFSGAALAADLSRIETIPRIEASITYTVSFEAPMGSPMPRPNRVCPQRHVCRDVDGWWLHYGLLRRQPNEVVAVGQGVHT